MTSSNLMRFLALSLFVFVTGCSGQKPLTVAEVVQNAERLDGKIIRVRALAYLWSDPTQPEMLLTGGCIPRTDPSYRQIPVKGWLTLYDAIDPDDMAGYGVPHDETGIKISEDNFRCEGDYCKMTCSAFEVVSERMYEFVGRLRVEENSKLILEDLDLDRSSQLVEREWVPIQRGDFPVFFP